MEQDDMFKYLFWGCCPKVTNSVFGDIFTLEWIFFHNVQDFVLDWRINSWCDSQWCLTIWNNPILNAIFRWTSEVNPLCGRRIAFWLAGVIRIVRILISRSSLSIIGAVRRRRSWFFYRFSWAIWIVIDFNNCSTIQWLRLKPLSLLCRILGYFGARLFCIRERCLLGLIFRDSR